MDIVAQRSVKLNQQMEGTCETCQYSVYHPALPGSLEFGPPEPAEYECLGGEIPMDAEGDPCLFICPWWRQAKSSDKPTPEQQARVEIARRKRLVEETLAGCCGRRPRHNLATRAGWRFGRRGRR